MVLSGDVKTFKSYLALNMAYQMSMGEPVLGYWRVDKPLSVLYIEMEVGEYELDERARVIDTFHQSSMIARENMKIISKDMEIQLDTATGIRILEQEIKEAAPDILILDPIVEFHSQEENSAIEMKKMMWPLRTILHSQKPPCSLIVVHHSTKPSEWRDGSTPSSVRGSYLAGVANSIINITKPTKRDDIIQLHFTTRSSKKLDPMTLMFDDKSGGFTSSASKTK